MSTLGYWKIRGLAQPIRLLLNYVGEQFEDVQYEQGDGPEFSRDAWLKVKPTLGLDFPNLPYYIDGDIKITQSNAILRYIARKHNLLGQTEQEQVNVDMMVENAMDFRNGVVRLCYNPDYEKLLKDYIPQCKETLKGFEKWLKNKSWFAGDNLTLADFPMYELLDQHRIMVPGILDDYPKLKAFMDAFEALPSIKTYMASDKFMKRPLNKVAAKFK
uniref:glutathione transferase n=1 Tax=Cipangopaludina cathayensis TaxID=570432 RepID=L7NCQ8_9CAEN|nr:mu-class gst glutathione S-transferase [Cipangopaludina cathayensis]